MDSFEWNKIAGAILGTVIFIFVVRLIGEAVYEAPEPAKPGYVVEGVVEDAGAGKAAAVEEATPDFGTVLAKADLAAGKAVSARCEQCHDLAKGGVNKIGPAMWGVIGRARATEAGFSYSSAMMASHDPWTFAQLFKYIKAPAIMVPGTKMSFAGIRSADERINLIAYLRTQSDAPVAIPAPQPVAAAAPETAAAAAPAKDGAAAPSTAAGAAPANAGDTAAKPGYTGAAAKPAATAPTAAPAPGATKAAPAPATAPKAAAPAK